MEEENHLYHFDSNKWMIYNIKKEPLFIYSIILIGLSGSFLFMCKINYFLELYIH